jgi:hypothetical protein
VACYADPLTCRRDHIAARLDDVRQDGTDFEARCPACGHGGFRVSQPTRSRVYRHIWTCACQRCKCSGALRGAQLRLGIDADCLGSYDGPIQRDIPPADARRMELAIRDILAVPGLKPADIRIMLAAAAGRKVPDDFTGFVRFARELGISKTQAQEAAARWCRPPDCRPPNRGAVADASRSTNTTALVKPPRSEPRERSVSDLRTVGFRPSDKTDTPSSDAMLSQNVRKSVSDQQISRDEPDTPSADLPEALAVLEAAGLIQRKSA